MLLEKNASKTEIREYIAKLELQASSNVPIVTNELALPLERLPLALRWYLEATQEVLVGRYLEKADYSSTIGGLLRDVPFKIKNSQCPNSEFELRKIEKGKPLVIFFKDFPL